KPGLIGDVGIEALIDQRLPPPDLDGAVGDARQGRCQILGVVIGCALRDHQASQSFLAVEVVYLVARHSKLPVRVRREHIIRLPAANALRTSSAMQKSCPSFDLLSSFIQKFQNESLSSIERS